MIEVQAARGLQDSLARAVVQDPTTDRKRGAFLFAWMKSVCVVNT